MPDGGSNCTERTLRDLAEVVGVPARALAARLSRVLAPFCAHDALVILASDTAGGMRRGAGDPAFVEGVSFLDLDELRSTLDPGTVRRGELDVAGSPTPVLEVVSRNGALLVVARPQADAAGEATVLQLWNIVAPRVQELADAAPPGYLRLARLSTGERMEALIELADEYSTTLESVLAALRSGSLDDRAARQTATGIAAEGLVHLRTASDRVRTMTEEPVRTAFARLRDDLGPLVRYRELEVQFIEPPEDGRPLPSEVAHGARAVVRGSILALIDSHDVTRIRVKWDCDGQNLLIDMRDDGRGERSDASTLLNLVRQRINALGGRLSVEATRGWGTEMSIVIPLDPPSSIGSPPQWQLRPRELEVLELIVTGRRNRQIASQLGISENTVKFHISRILRKLGAGSRAEAVGKVLAAQGP